MGCCAGVRTLPGAGEATLTLGAHRRRPHRHAEPAEGGERSISTHLSACETNPPKADHIHSACVGGDPSLTFGDVQDDGVGPTAGNKPGMPERQ